MEVYLPIADLPVDMFQLLAMGAAVGFVSGMFGVGGGFLLTPLLIFMGIPPAVAVATQAPQVVASATTSVLAAMRRDALDRRLGLVLVCGGLVGTGLGILFFSAMRRLGQLDLVIVIAYVTLLGTVGGLMLFESVKTLTASRRGVPPALPAKQPWHAGLRWQMSFPHAGITVGLVPLLGVALFVGFAGAVLGIGGGFILVPALIYLFRVPVALAVGTSQFQILFTMMVAAMLHAVTGRTVDIILAAILIVGSVFGAQFGARAGRNLKGEIFRLLLALIIVGVGLRFAVELTVKPRDLFTIAPIEVSG